MADKYRVTRFHYRSQVEPAIRRFHGLRPILKRRADEMVPHAKSIAPVGDYTGGGDYRDSIDSIVYMAHDGLRGRLVATDFKAWWIEVGTAWTPARHVLARAATMAGYRLRAGT
jgi:hypothetical protein